MPFVHLPQVVQRNPFFSLSVSLLNPFQAKLRRTPEVNDGLEGTVLDHFGTDLAVDFIFCLVQVALTVHDLTEDMAVCEGRPFREEDLARLFLDGGVPEEGAGVESIELEGEGPSLGVLVVIFEDVASCHFFPLVHGLFDN